jgi:hypothetical protein
MVRSRGGSSSQGGSSRRDKGKGIMVEEEPSQFPPLNEYQDEHRTRCFSQPEDMMAVSQKGFRYRQHGLDVCYLFYYFLYYLLYYLIYYSFYYLLYYLFYYLCYFFFY